MRLKSRTVVPGSPYEFPATRVNPLELDAEAFRAQMDDSDTDLVRTLATQLNFGGLYAEELCTRAGVAKTEAIEDATESQYDALYDAVQGLRADLESRLDPRIYYEDDAPVDVTPFPLEERADLRAESRETFNGALDDYFQALESEAEADERERPDFEAEIQKRERIIDQQEAAIENFEREAESLRESAEALYEHYGLVDEVLSTVRAARADDTPWSAIRERFEEGKEREIAAAEAVADLDPSEGTVTLELDGERVTLDPQEGVEHNADRLYTEAKNVEEKREGALEAVENTREELAETEQRRDRWEAEDGEEGAEGSGDDEGDGGDGEDRDWLSEPSIPVRKNEQWYEGFRWFRTSDDFLVIGGRDADQNEQLVKKYLDAGDKFLHAQAHGGPVTILKAAGPSESARDVTIPDRSLEEAAKFAVSYSSVWKEGKFAGDVYAVDHDQVSKTPESGEYLEKGGFAVRGDRTYFDDVPVGVAVGITCEPETRVIGGPPAPVGERAETPVAVEPGRFAQGDVAKRVYREFRERFADTSFVRKVASPDLIAHFLPPGTSRIKKD